MTSTMTALAAPAPPAPRLAPPPRTEPPYDDELPPPGASPHLQGAVQETLALTFTLRTGVAAKPLPATAPSTAPAAAPSTAPAAAPSTAPAAGPPAGRGPRLRLVPDNMRDETSAGLPDPQAWAGTLAQAVVEVLAGDRPVAQLLRWTTARIYTELGRRAAIAGRECTAVRAGRARAVVRRVHVFQPAEGVAEASAVLSDGRRTRAMALRLQSADGRWLCTALELG